MRRVSFFFFIQPTVSEHILLQSRDGLTSLRRFTLLRRTHVPTPQINDLWNIVFSFPDPLFEQHDFDLSSLEKSIAMFKQTIYLSKSFIDIGRK